MFFNGAFPFSQNVRYQRHHAQHHESNDVSFREIFFHLKSCSVMLLDVWFSLFPSHRLISQ